MPGILKEIFDWSESWAPLIPLSVISRSTREKQPGWPIHILVVFSFLLYLVINLSWKLHDRLDWWFILHDNRILYNAASILRVICFSIFFIRLRLPFKGKYPWLLPSIYILLLCWAFFFRREQWISFGDVLHSCESILLIFYALSYYLRTLLSDQAQVLRTPEFWVITGLFVYEAVSLPIFMLFNRLVTTDENFAVDIWDIHNIAFLVMFTCIAKSYLTPTPHGR